MGMNKEIARQDFRNQQCQNNEGGVPCAISYIAGHLDGQNVCDRDVTRLLDEVERLDKLVEDLKAKMCYHVDRNTDEGIMENKPCSMCEINCGRPWCFTNRGENDDDR